MSILLIDFNLSNFDSIAFNRYFRYFATLNGVIFGVKFDSKAWIQFVLTPIVVNMESI